MLLGLSESIAFAVELDDFGAMDESVDEGALPDDPRLRTLSVRPHDLADYDRLHDESDSGDEDAHRDDNHEQDTND